MALLFAVIYDDEATADAAFDRAEGLEDLGVMTILDQALITKNDKGKIEVDNEKHPVRRGAVVGGVIGGLTGAIFLMPVVGAAAGAAIGGVIGKGNKSGGEDDFKSFTESVEMRMKPGDAAMVMLAETDARERVVHDLGQFGGTFYSYDISDEEVAQIQKEIDRASGQ